MGKWPELGDRIRQRIQQLGYISKDGSADVQRFALAKGYLPNYLYRWLNDTTPGRENLLKLASDLECSPAWLLFGEEKTKRRGRRFIAGLLLAFSTGGTLLNPEPYSLWENADFADKSRGIMSTWVAKIWAWLHRCRPPVVWAPA